MKKLIVLDHFLTSRRGHEEAYDFSIAREATGQGIETEIWSPRRVGLQPDFVKQKLWPPFWEEKNKFLLVCKAFLSIFEWRRLFKRNINDSEYLVLIQSVRSLILLFLYLGTFGIRINSKVIIILRRELDFLGKPAAFLVKQLHKRGFLFFTDSELIKEELKRKGFNDARTLPIPHIPAYTPTLGKDKKITIGYLGGARFDKGFDLLPDIIRLALKDRPDLQFFVHAYERNKSTYYDENINNLRGLHCLFPENIRIFDRFLSEDEYLALINACSIILVPCRKEFYGKGTSGILAESVALGKWVLVPEGTWMSDQRKYYKKIIGFSGLAAPEIVNSIKTCMIEEKRIDKEEMKNQIRKWVDFHSASNYVKILKAL